MRLSIFSCFGFCQNTGSYRSTITRAIFSLLAILISLIGKLNFLLKFLTITASCTSKIILLGSFDE